jgi:hypothetical protein
LLAQPTKRIGENDYIMDKLRAVLSLDDFYSANSDLSKLDKLNDYFDDFKVTLFAIPTCMPESWVETDVLARPYLQVAIHGYYHTMQECVNWSTLEAVKNITEAEESWTVKGFKAPFWIDSTGTLEACHRLGYWVAMNGEEPPYGDAPDGLKIFYHDTDIANIPEEWDKEYLKLHGHIQNVCGNGLPECFNEVKRIPRDTEFMWIDDYVKEAGGDPLKWKFRKNIPYDCYSLGMHSLYGGYLEASTIEKLWDIAKEKGGPVLQIGGGPATVVFGAAVNETVVNTVPQFQFDMSMYVNKYGMSLMSIGEPTDPETPKNIPQGFKAKILYIDVGDQNPSILRAVYQPFLMDDGVIITKSGNALQIEEKVGDKNA